MTLFVETFKHYCKYYSGEHPMGWSYYLILIGKWLICWAMKSICQIFTNVQLLRQLVEHNGFYYSSDQQRVSLILKGDEADGWTDIKTIPPVFWNFDFQIFDILNFNFFVSDSFGMFLKCYIDYPALASLSQIYGTFNRAVSKIDTIT